MASSTDCSPPCIMNSFTFLCAENENKNENYNKNVTIHKHPKNK